MQCSIEVGITGSRVGDYVIEAELPDRAGGVFVSTHVLLPRRAHVVLCEPEHAFELACVLEQLRHPAVPRIYECGRLADHRPWFAMALVEGPTLAERIASQPLAVIEAAQLLRDLAIILAHAHGKGIVHGGLGAEHVVHTPTGWQIADWRDAGPADDHVTDLRALGALAYAALARALPTQPLAQRCPGVPAPLARMIDGLLDPSETAASGVATSAVRLVEDLAQPAPDDDAVPIEIEDIVLLDVSRPPLVPVRLRVRAQGTGPVLQRKES